MSRLSGTLVEQTWDPGSVAQGGETTVDVTVPGASLGDFAFVSFSIDTGDLILYCAVTSENTVSVNLGNVTGSSVNLGSGTLRVKVIPFDVI